MAGDGDEMLSPMEGPEDCDCCFSLSLSLSDFFLPKMAIIATDSPPDQEVR